MGNSVRCLLNSSRVSKTNLEARSSHMDQVPDRDGAAVPLRELVDHTLGVIRKDSSLVLFSHNKPETQ